MGMFDEVQSEVPLPDHYSGPLQTKDFDCILTTILIRRDGRLMINDQKFEVVPLNERPFPDHARLRFFGSFRVVEESWRDLNYHGDFEFYGSDRATGKLHRYRARYTHGYLESIMACPGR